MTDYNSTGDKAVQDVIATESYSLLLLWSRRARKLAPQFAWPMLILFAAGPGLSILSDSSRWPWMFVASLPLFVCGLTLRLWSRGFYRKDGFVIDGPYRYVRNPVELGAVLCYAGVGLLLGLPNWYNFLCQVIAVAFLTFVTVDVDRELTNQFGTLYLRYSQRIRRWVPTSLPGTNRSKRNFSLLHALSNEIWSLFWVLGMGLVIFLRHRLATLR